MTFGRSSVLTLALLTLALGACGSDSGSDAGSGSGTGRGTATELTVKCAATEGDGAAPDATEVDITGTIRCSDDGATGTGVYEDTAADLCSQMVEQRGPLTALSKEDPDGRMCAQIYGGPQHATVTGTIEGQPVDIDVQRTNGCGIDDWQSLEWLLGPPER
jgi:hypothetical protein